MLDLNMPGGSRLDGIPEIRAECPGTQVVVLTMQDEPAYARHALGAGALGYVLRESAESAEPELVEAICRAAAGDTYLNPGWALESRPNRRPVSPMVFRTGRWRCCG